MSTPSRRTLVALSGAILLAVGVACSDSTGPDQIPRTLGGTYDLSTVLDSLTYTDSCANLTSNGGLPACHDTTIANTVGTLEGTMVFGDTIRSSAPGLVFPIGNAALRLGECGTSCSPSVAQFSVAPASVDRTGRDSLEFVATVTGPAWIDFNGWIAGDSIAGNITVITSVNCCTHRSYTGSFVLKRRPPEY